MNALAEKHVALDKLEGALIRSLTEKPRVAPGESGYSMQEAKRGAAAREFARIDAERVVLLSKKHI